MNPSIPAKAVKSDLGLSVSVEYDDCPALHLSPKVTPDRAYCSVAAPDGLKVCSAFCGLARFGGSGEANSVQSICRRLSKPVIQPAPYPGQTPVVNVSAADEGRVVKLEALHCQGVILAMMSKPDTAPTSVGTRIRNWLFGCDSKLCRHNLKAVSRLGYHFSINHGLDGDKVLLDHALLIMSFDGATGASDLGRLTIPESVVDLCLSIGALEAVSQQTIHHVHDSNPEAAADRFRSFWDRFIDFTGHALDKRDREDHNHAHDFYAHDFRWKVLDAAGQPYHHSRLADRLQDFWHDWMRHGKAEKWYYDMWRHWNSGVPEQDHGLPPITAAEQSFKPPANVAKEAAEGLELRRKASPSNKGGLTVKQASEQGIGSGVQRAVDLKNRRNLTLETVKRMSSFFARHEKNKEIDPSNKDTPWNDKGFVAWKLWGGDSGKAWVDSILKGNKVTAENAELTPEKRESRPKREFALPERKAWWLPDVEHALIALQYMQAKRGKPEDYAIVLKEVRRRFGDDPKVKSKLAEVSKMLKENT